MKVVLHLDKKNKVCKLCKSLYGLKQAPKQRHKKFDMALLNNRFLSIEVDKCVKVVYDLAT